MYKKLRINKELHYIHGNPSTNTLAQYLLMKRDYEDQCDVPSWVNTEKHRKRWDQMVFNTKFMQATLKQFGELHCEFCGKPHLVIYSWNDTRPRVNVATVDHFVPISKDESLATDEENLLVACEECNNRKASKAWPVSSIKFKYKR